MTVTLIWCPIRMWQSWSVTLSPVNSQQREVSCTCVYSPCNFIYYHFSTLYYVLWFSWFSTICRTSFTFSFTSTCFWRNFFYNCWPVQTSWWNTGWVTGNILQTIISYIIVSHTKRYLISFVPLLLSSPDLLSFYIFSLIFLLLLSPLPCRNVSLSSHPDSIMASVSLVWSWAAAWIALHHSENNWDKSEWSERQETRDAGSLAEGSGWRAQQTVSIVSFEKNWPHLICKL